MRFRRKAKVDPPVVRKIVFPPNKIDAYCWCRACGWEIYPTGWYDDPGGKITMEMLIDLWQDAHDDDGECRMSISWTEDDQP